MSAAEQFVIPAGDKPLAAYDPFRSQLEAMKAANATVVFDYSKPAGIKEARSYIHKIRLSKKPVDDARVAAKAAALAYGRKVDAEANEIIQALDSMIDQHLKPIEEAEERERLRVADIRSQIAFIGSLTATALDTPKHIEAQLTRLAGVTVDDSFAEFEAEAIALYTERMDALNAALAGAKKREAEEAELAALRAEKAKRDQEDRERQLAIEAAERARLDAEAEAEARRQDAERLAQAEIDAAAARERAERERAERAEADAREAEERAARAVEAEQARVREEQRQAELARVKREADTAHKAKINREAAAALQKIGLSDALAKSVIAAIVSGKVPRCRIDY